jgi:hypothetical protein
MELYIMKFKLDGQKIKNRDISKLRGYLASRFPEYIELHNHLDDKKYIYGYPQIQYKVIKGIPNIFAINYAALNLYDVMNKADNINIEGKMIGEKNKFFSMEKFNFGYSKNEIEYEFLSPWMALNQINYKKYNSSNTEDKKDLLNKILIGNIISMSKYLNYEVENEIYSKINLYSTIVNYKNNKMIGFKGRFKINFMIPDFLGLGKSVSRGFGMVKSYS